MAFVFVVSIKSFRRQEALSGLVFRYGVVMQGNFGMLIERGWHCRFAGIASQADAGETGAMVFPIAVNDAEITFSTELASFVT